MPCPKWKLVVDIGDAEESPATPPVASVSTDQIVKDSEPKDDHEFNILDSLTSSSSAAISSHMTNTRDARVSDVVALLGEFTPSDPSSSLYTYVSGFMSLRLLLLRQSRSPEEEDFVKTMLDSFSSYTAGGRERADIAVMLARVCMFLTQQQQQQSVAPGQPGAPYLGLSHGVVAQSQSQQAAGSVSLFGLPSTNSSHQNSPALAPIPVPGNVDSMSIVSN